MGSAFFHKKSSQITSQENLQEKENLQEDFIKESLSGRLISRIKSSYNEVKNL